MDVALGCQKRRRKQCAPGVLSPVPNQPRLFLLFTGAALLPLLSLVVVGGSSYPISLPRGDSWFSSQVLVLPLLQEWSGLAVKRRQTKNLSFATWEQFKQESGYQPIKRG